MIIQTREINALRVLLLELCHAEGCKNLHQCPRQCGCRARRTFELNTETAICWQIADELWDFQRSRRGQHGRGPSKPEVENIIFIVQTFNTITRFHMSKGWQRFFESVERLITEFTFGKVSSHFPKSGLDAVRYLKMVSKQLKREPREI